MSARKALTALVVTILVAVPSTSPASAAKRAIMLPPANAQFDYQIGGSYTPAASVGIVDRDRKALAVAGKYSICYVNAFQTQPDERAFWTTGANASLLLKKTNGSYVTDPGYPDEILLDTRTTAKRAAIAVIMDTWFAGCATSGFKAIEPDNLDSWTRSGKRLTQSGNAALATLLAQKAHARGLAIAQKNTTELLASRKAIGFDFAVAEECNVFSECTSFTAEYGNQVYEIEYTDGGGVPNFNAACSALGSQISIIYRDRDVLPTGSAGYTYRAC